MKKESNIYLGGGRMVSLGQTMDFLTIMLFVLLCYNIHTLYLIRIIDSLKSKRDEMHALLFSQGRSIPEKYQRSKDYADSKIAFDRKMEKVILAFSYFSIVLYLGVYKFSH